MAADNMKYIFGLRVSEFRRLNGLTQKELALKTGVTTSFITKMERGLKLPTLENALLFACCLGVPVSWLCYNRKRASGNPPNELLQLAQMPKSHRMAVMNQRAESIERIWSLLKDFLEERYGNLLGFPWQSAYWKVFALFYILQHRVEYQASL